MYKAPMGDYG